jgi:heme/copper-type cytochrome/quinol oxidase subunit 2
MVEIATQMIVYLYGAVSIIIIVLLWIAYMVWKSKRMLRKAIDYEQSNQGY